jgi:hypothetical protein
LPAALLAAQQALDENGQRLFELQRLIGERHRDGAGGGATSYSEKEPSPSTGEPRSQLG